MKIKKLGVTFLMSMMCFGLLLAIYEVVQEKLENDVSANITSVTSTDISSPNLLINSSFENGAAGWTYNPGSAGGNGSGGVTSEAAKLNSNAYKITLNAGGVWAVVQADSLGSVSNGQTFTLSGWVKTTGDVVAILKTQSTDDWTPYGVQELSNANNWQFVSKTFTITNNHSGFQAVIGAGSSSGTVYFDGIRLIKGSFSIESYKGMARFGIGRLTDVLTTEQDMIELDDYKFGWFHNWFNERDLHTSLGVTLTAEIPDSLEYSGLVGGWGTAACTCSEDVKSKLSKYKDGDVIWIGNEIGWDDKRDPTKYAEQYKGWYDCIKSVNQNIKVAPGANPGSPLFLYEPSKWVNSVDPTGAGRWSAIKKINYIEYMTYVKQDYLSIHGEKMPIDAHVIHVYPFGGTSWHDVAYIESTIRAFRQYMKDEGDERKDLFIKEMGILPDSESDWEKNKETMINTYEMLQNLKDVSIGNPNDNNRLVQRWSWYQAPIPCEAPGYTTCTWPYTGYFICHRLSSWQSDCTVYRAETPLAEAYKKYVRGVWEIYDYTPPNKPEISYELKGTTANVTFSAVDNGRINNYEISVGNIEGEADVMLWTSTDTATSYKINDAVGKYVNVKAVDDGYNWSEAASRRIEGDEDSKLPPEDKSRNEGQNDIDRSNIVLSENIDIINDDETGSAESVRSDKYEAVIAQDNNIYQGEEKGVTIFKDNISRVKDFVSMLPLKVIIILLVNTFIIFIIFTLLKLRNAKNKR